MKIKIIVFTIILMLLLTCFVAVWAVDLMQDYRKVIYHDPTGEDIFKPTSQFSILYNETTYKSPVGNDINSNSIVINAFVGDIVTVKDMSHSNRGKALIEWDFQYTKPDGSVQLIKTKDFEKSYTLDIPGIYTFSLCVRDTVENEDWIFHWGNWSDNGNHRVIGNNPGENLADPSDDFNGYWYFTRIVVDVKKNSAIPNFKILYKSSDVTDNKTSPVTVDPGDKSLVLQDYSEPYSIYDPITGRKWYYWDVNSGWREIPGSANKTTVNISDMDKDLLGSGINKAFKLVLTTESGTEPFKEHTGYFKKALSCGYIIYYRDAETDLDVYTPKVREGLGFGTYIENALPVPENGELITTSPQTIKLSEATPFVEFIFYYVVIPPTPPPTSKPPTAILVAPDTVMAGQPVKADGGKSWSNNPDGYIANFYFDCEGANLIRDNRSYISIWYPKPGTYTIHLQVEDENGSTDWVEHEITVTPPIPKAVLDITGKLKENRKVTMDCSASISPPNYPIDTKNIVWKITPKSGGTASDIKYNGVLNGNVSKDVLFKKAGTYEIEVTVPNTYGLFDTTKFIITISTDLPPVAELFLPSTKLVRDPADSNYATSVFFNESYSSDDDIIDKAVAMYSYDSDNDGDFQEEVWYYSTDGTTWLPTGMSYADMLGYFNIYNIATSNVTKFTIKSKEVGRYSLKLRVMETIPDNETMPEFLNESDYRRADTFN